MSHTQTRLFAGGAALLVMAAGGGLWFALQQDPAPAEVAPEASAPTPPPARGPDVAHEGTPTVPKPPPNREVPLPTVEPAPPSERTRPAHPLKATQELTEARAVLVKVVEDHGRDPGNPWAVAHSMLALGSDVELVNGASAIDHLFATYAETVDVGSEGPGDDFGLAFPKRRGTIRIEPHSDLILKAIVEGGVQPDRQMQVQQATHPVLALYRHSLHRTWAESRGATRQTSLASMNDTPWALQALSGWAPQDYAWTAIGGHDMTMDGFTETVLAELSMATAQLMDARSRGVMPKKDGKGILSYTCGGQHLVQGAAHAVARGFGPSDAEERMCEQRDLLRWRIDHELGSIDPLFEDERVKESTPLQVVLLDQRLKFVGHAMETLAKFDAYGYCEWSEADAKAQERLGVELVRTVKALQGLDILDDIGVVRTDKAYDPYRANSGGAEQVYLDLLGDSAHAVRGIDLATGQSGIGVH